MTLLNESSNGKAKILGGSLGNHASHLQRFTRGLTCPVCGGSDDDPRGNGSRCFGFLTDGWIHCTREDHASGCDFHATSSTFSHKAKGTCRCGTEHAPADFIPDGKPKRKAGKAKAKAETRIDFDNPVRTYDYADADDKPVMQVRRLNVLDGSGKVIDKTFRQYRWTDTGWEPGIEGVQLVLYRLSYLLGNPTRKAWIAEGEKDVDHLHLLGKIATCNPMGAGKWRDEYAEFLRGRHVVILPDNDQVGREHALKIAQSLHGVAASIKIVEIPGLPEKGDVSDWMTSGGFGLPVLAVQLEELARNTPEWKPEGSTSRPEIEVTTQRHTVRDAAIEALARDERVFLRGDVLAIAHRPQESSEKLFGGIMARNASGAPRIKLLNEATAGCFLTEAATFYKWTKVSGEDVAKDCHPPDWLIRSVIASPEYPGFRPLLSVAECPFVGRDGSIVSRAGYDEATGTLLSPAFKLGVVPDRITKEDVTDACARLYDLVKGFPFEDGDSFYVWLAGLFTAIQRPMIAGPVPGFAFNANKAGCGKGLLIDVIGRLVWGGPVPAYQYPHDDAEAEKTVLALALGGIQAVHLDNLAEGRFYGDSSLDSALTLTTKGGRVLGMSKVADGVPLRPWWAISGNNISPGKDAYRRWLPCNLITTLERPHERGDVSSDVLLEKIAKDRGRIITDALLILKAHADAGRPSHGMPRLGSYEEWDGIVRAAVWFIEGIDCLAPQRKAADDSPDRLKKLALLEAWRDEIPNQENGYTAEEVVKLVTENPAAYPLMHAVLMSRGQKGKPIEPEKFGYALRPLKNANIGGLKFVEMLPKRHNKTVWLVVKA